MADRTVVFQDSTGALKGVSSTADNVLCNGIQFGADVTLSRGTADRVDLASGDSLNIVGGELLIGGTTVFQSDRDLAINIVPSSDVGVSIGTTSRRVNTVNAYIYQVIANAGDTQPMIQIAPNYIRFGAGGASAYDVEIARGGANLINIASGDSLNLVNGSLQFGAGTVIDAGGHATFTTDATDPGVNVGSVGGDPSSLSNGDIWYNSSTNKFRGRENGASVDLVSAGAASGWTDGGAEVYLTTSGDEVTVGASGGTLGKFTVRGDNTAQVTIVGRAVAAQTADLLTLEDSSAVSLLTLSTAGGLGTTYVSNGVTANYVVYKNTTSDRVAHANATAISTCGTVVGVARSTVGAGSNVVVTYGGLVTLDAAAGITVTTGDTVYASTTAGEVSNVPPSSAGNVILRLGYAKTTSASGGTFVAQWMPGEPVVVG